MDSERLLWQSRVGFRLCPVPIRPLRGSCNILSERDMDTLHCSSYASGSAAQCNRHVSAMPPSPSRTLDTALHPGTADTLL